VTADLVFTISLKRSTPNLQLSTSWPADYPISAPKATDNRLGTARAERPLMLMRGDRRRTAAR
jgi:hypothetical protein